MVAALEFGLLRRGSAANEFPDANFVGFGDCRLIGVARLRPDNKSAVNDPADNAGNLRQCRTFPRGPKLETSDNYSGIVAILNPGWRGSMPSWQNRRYRRLTSKSSRP
jgi:hypothetical protein